jgi:N-acetylmuramoyl-L-alanine amidase
VTLLIYSAVFSPLLNRVSKRLCVNCFACVLLMAVFVSPGFASDVKDIRLWRAPDHTRVVLDLSAPVEHKVMVLSKPSRIVVDINRAKLKANVNDVDLQSSPVSRIRSGIKDKNDLRVVFDVTSKVRPRSFLLKANGQYGDRLVIDLYDTQKVKTVVKRADAIGKKRDIIVAIDAGHGGEDPGASGPGRLREKAVVLSIAKALKNLFTTQKGYKPLMIRNGDYYVGLEKRRSLARKAQADLMISIHADAFKDHRARGTSVYALSTRGASSASAKFLADEANNSDLVGGVSLVDKGDVLAGVLTDLSMTASLDASMKIGRNVLKSMGKVSHLHSRKVEQASFVVLKSPDIPSILVETGFISNPTEAKKLKTSGYQKKMAKAIFTGVTSYFVSSPPPGTYLAWQKQNRSKRVEYVISAGDTLSGIASRYQVSVESIRKINDLASNVIRVGQKIVIPST